MAAPTATFLYKILPAFPAPSSPLPLVLPLSDSDKRDCFIHLSTSHQVIRTLNKFFATAPHIYILRIPYGRVASYIRWEPAPVTNPGPMPPEFFPHLFPNARPGSADYGLKLGRDEVDAVACWFHGDAEWDKADWPFDIDLPM